MTPRERMLRAIRFEEPDRVPTFTNLTPQVAERLKLLNLSCKTGDSFLRNLVYNRDKVEGGQ